MAKSLKVLYNTVIFQYDDSFRTRLVEKQVFEEKEELKSKLESTMEDKFKLEKVRIAPSSFLSFLINFITRH